MFSGGNRSLEPKEQFPPDPFPRKANKKRLFQILSYFLNHNIKKAATALRPGRHGDGYFFFLTGTQMAL